MLVEVFLLIWWWFLVLGVLGLARVLYRMTQCRSGWLRFKLLDIRLHRYLRRSAKLENIKQFILECKLGDW